MCVFKATCNPEKQMMPCKKFPYGTEWAFCEKVNAEVHKTNLRCLNYECVEEETIEKEMYNLSLTENYVERIIDFYKKNYSVVEIAKMFNCHYSTIFRILKKTKVYKKQTPLSIRLENYKDEILLLYSTYDKITYDFVVKYLKSEYNIETTTVTIGMKIKKWKEEEKNENN